ncbi:conserved hypothetical protein [Burkholderia cepacia]|uniref:hypothetical protein n=1 Tax=Burkholderia cepacia TaxID=292 RepID=UPI001CAF6B38|nr:hypothetical protein [Burkholderia cepacia]CAG9270585.1 conserved hypothetical protein [Burkholderia cepacia]
MVQRRNEPFASSAKTCQWINLPEAMWHFATYDGRTQSQEHIKPLHWYVACRLVVEGGFDPDEITPRPPFEVVRRKGKNLLVYAPEKANGGERTILGGLKTKNVDVVVTKDGIGPVLAVSCKGMTGAFRNLTNRMEETIGECTNLHITYPALVFGFLFVIRANRQREEAVEAVSELVAESASAARQLAANDIALQPNNEPVESIFRFHSALRELTGRRGIRDDVSRYEAVSLVLTEAEGEHAGLAMTSFPPEGSPLRFGEFFQTLYLRYEERFLIGAPDLKSVTRRLEWDPESPAFSQLAIDSNSIPTLDFTPRVQVE